MHQMAATHIAGLAVGRMTHMEIPVPGTKLRVKQGKLITAEIDFLQGMVGTCQRPCGANGSNADLFCLVVDFTDEGCYSLYHVLLVDLEVLSGLDLMLEVL